MNINTSQTPEASTNSAGFQFSDLTPDLILNGIESIGVFAESGLLALNSYENRVYQFIDQDRTRWVVKFYRPQRWTDAQILEEHAFASALSDAEIPVVAPVHMQGSTLHHYQGYRFSLFPSVGGRQFEVDNLDQLEQVGRYLGRIHAVGQASPFEFRPAFDIDQYLYQPQQQLIASGFVPHSLQTPFFTILEQVIAATAERFSDDGFIRLHGDCHPSNILWRDGPSILDLDDCRMGPAIQDLWMMLSGDRQQQQLQLEVLVEAYEEFNTFVPSQLGQVEVLRAMRMVHYMAWLAKRWEDAAFPKAFPWFASEKYWEQQILALKEQLSALNEPPLKLMTGF
ncbi:serine/threonine protein kinase [Alteromonas facilis]|uniref:serine/threonine protein kinase n=1 Tax=Alteromonas facilis TaxID=2048004 RepID=UPI0023E8EA97|nr:serine/threonine protein kinase [Alteromonas facilis]